MVYVFIIQNLHMELIQFHEEKCRGRRETLTVELVNVKAVGLIKAE